MSATTQFSVARKLATLMDISVDDDQLNFLAVVTLAAVSLLVFWLINTAITNAVRFGLYTTAFLLAVAVAGRIIYGDWELLRDTFGCDCRNQCASGGTNGWVLWRLAWKAQQLAGGLTPEWLVAWLWE